MFNVRVHLSAALLRLMDWFLHSGVSPSETKRTLCVSAAVELHPKTLTLTGTGSCGWWTVEQTASSAGRPDTECPLTLGIQARYKYLVLLVLFGMFLKKKQTKKTKPTAYLIVQKQQNILKNNSYNWSSSHLLPCEHACFRKRGALPGSELSVIRHQTNSLHPPPPQGPNRAALPPLFVLCLIRTEEMCGHDTFERIAVKGQRRLPTSYFNRSRPDGS